MRIYADPDLPDVRGQWDASECEPDSTVLLTAMLVPAPRRADANAELDVAYEATAPCSEGRAVVPDVERSKLAVQGVLRSATGETLSIASDNIDTRDGNNKKAFLTFPDPSFGRLRVTWSFGDGGTCESNGVEFVSLRLASGAQVASFFAPCADAKPLEVPEGTYTAQAFGQAINGETIRRSAPIENVVIAPRGALTELGEVRLDPCSGTCDRSAFEEPAIAMP